MFVADFFPEPELVWVGMSHPVWAEPFEDAPVITPQQEPAAHVVVGGVVDDTRPPGAVRRGVHIE